ncbi:uncharacterized protein KNAG_0G00310 [Huiozyma naganishii CBS 8797]|uniref:Uncharacterized protein n=1 Tax=Huiozyma naganishii (strain ATCC MYA-139 / BCRC 22969 / CBS 8797 / KCTC 17520 / NBRC 10181 / NCYC 3082 / Yp74L-3) TaxID=1071383 RepID=J7S7P7_HUIN7|nr:hypothetical protein KNAG_0G00310 [Kazachstania naganishii CBS 8797]CCK71089.1 hypothetical protein KNAG_0G00310 [Kazachstania naganishii CBS 8797]
MDMISSQVQNLKRGYTELELELAVPEAVKKARSSALLPSEPLYQIGSNSQCPTSPTLYLQQNEIQRYTEHDIMQIATPVNENPTSSCVVSPSMEPDAEIEGYMLQGYYDNSKHLAELTTSYSIYDMTEEEIDMMMVDGRPSM